jgi:hypothetical protein
VLLEGGGDQHEHKAGAHLGERNSKRGYRRRRRAADDEEADPEGADGSCD